MVHTAVAARYNKAGAGMGGGVVLHGRGGDRAVVLGVTCSLSCCIKSDVAPRAGTRDGVFHASKDSPSKHTAKSWQKLLQKIEHT